ncbi:MAG: hypothetical protein ACSHXF_14195 [Aquaticitalea sp.]
MDKEIEAAGVRMAMVLMLTWLYSIKVRSKQLFFFLFLITFSLGQIFAFSSYFVEIDYNNSIDYFYYIGNSLFILSYIFLTIRVLKDLNITHVLKRFWIHLVILLILDIFCVVILSDFTIKILTDFEFSLEVFYNMIIMTLLTIAMINYMSKNTQKSMNLLLGAIFIFFSEVIQMTYFYVSEINILNVICSLFLVLAFLFFYLQARTPLETEHDTLHQNIRA